MVTPKVKASLIDLVKDGDLSNIHDFLSRYAGQVDDILAVAFLLACRLGKINVVVKLLDHVNPNVRNGDGFTGLMQATTAQCGGIEGVCLITLLLDRGCDPNLVDSSGRTALHWAAKGKNLEAVRALLKAGVNTNAHDRQCRTPLMYAVQVNAAQIVYQLVHAGADPMKCMRDKETALHVSVRYGATAAFSKLLPFCTTVDPADQYGVTPLYLAVHFGHVDIVRLLVTTPRNVDVNKRNAMNKRTPLEEACANNHTEIVRLLLDAGADPNTSFAPSRESSLGPLPDKSRSWGETKISPYAQTRKEESKLPAPAIVFAVENGNAEILEMLLKKKAKVNITSQLMPGFRRGTTPLSLAAEQGHLTMVYRLANSARDQDKELQESGGESSFNIDGLDPTMTPLTTAAGMGQFETVGALLELGANPSAPYPSNVPALMRLLMKHYADEKWPQVRAAVFDPHPTAVSAVLNRGVAQMLASAAENAELREGFVRLARHFPISDLRVDEDVLPESPYLLFMQRYLSDRLKDSAFCQRPKTFFDSLGDNFPPRLVMAALCSRQVMEDIIRANGTYAIYVLMEGLVDFAQTGLTGLRSPVELAICNNNLEAALFFVLAGSSCSFLHEYQRLGWSPMGQHPDWMVDLLQELAVQPRSLQTLCQQTIRRHLRPNKYLCTHEDWKQLDIDLPTHLKVGLALLRDELHGDEFAVVEPFDLFQKFPR